MKEQELTSRTILEESTKVEIGGKEYLAPPPTLATLIKVSEITSKLQARYSEQDEAPTETMAVLNGVIENRYISEVIATIILGVRRGKTFWERITTRVHTNKDIKRLAKRIELTATPRELQLALITLLGHLQLEEFFFITTFLRQIDLTGATKEGGPEEDDKRTN